MPLGYLLGGISLSLGLAADWHGKEEGGNNLKWALCPAQAIGCCLQERQEVREKEQAERKGRRSGGGMCTWSFLLLRPGDVQLLNLMPSVSSELRPGWRYDRRAKRGYRGHSSMPLTLPPCPVIAPQPLGQSH